MDTTQLFLTFILILTTGFLVTVGIQLFYALREFRMTLKRVNGILDTVEDASNELKFSLAGIVNLFEGFKSVLKTLEVINLLTPLHEYLRRKHPIISKNSSPATPARSSNGIHSLIDKMKAASSLGINKKFVLKSKKIS